MIEPREYARQESRRGRRHAYQQLVPDRTALVVVDMVLFFVEHGDYERGIVPNISLLADTLRGLGGTVAWPVANVCCESSARDASTLGYRVLMVADATAARRDQDLNATLHTIYRTFGDVRPTTEVLTLLQTRKRPRLPERAGLQLTAGAMAGVSDAVPRGAVVAGGRKVRR